MVLCTTNVCRYTVYALKYEQYKGLMTNFIPTSFKSYLILRQIEVLQIFGTHSTSRHIGPAPSAPSDNQKIFQYLDISATWAYLASAAPRTHSTAFKGTVSRDFPGPVWSAVGLHCKEIWIYVFPEQELRGLSPNFHIHVSVGDLRVYCIFIPTFGPPISLQ